jgi:hypothetical protein
MGTIIEISIFMLIAASVAFAPLAYFIYVYTKKGESPFDQFEHNEEHGHSIIDELAEKAIDVVKEKLH